VSLSIQLLDVARRRVATKIGEVTEADLRRAQSDLYYAMLHRISEGLVAAFQPDPANRASVDGWTTLYRLPEHAIVVKRCSDGRVGDFDNLIQRFANQFTSMRSKRLSADYDPTKRISISEVKQDLAAVETALLGVDTVSPEQFSAFCFFVSLKPRRAD